MIRTTSSYKVQTEAHTVGFSSTNDEIEVSFGTRGDIARTSRLLTYRYRCGVRYCTRCFFGECDGRKA